MKKLLAALLAALAAPAGAQASDYLIVYVNPTKVAPGWTLSGSVVSGSFSTGDDVFGLTLSRSRAGGSEQHALRSHHRASTISFDGRAGRWRTKGQLGTAAAVDMTIEVTGSSEPLGQALGCIGEFRSTPIRLAGTFALRTGTRFFGTVRRVKLAGVAVHEQGLVACPRPEPPVCAPSASLQAGGPRRSLNVDSRSLTLSFSEAVASAPARSTDWYHVMSVTGYDALRGELPRITVPAPPRLVRGSATFVARSTSTSGTTCPVATTTGDMTGSFSASFSGWGARTLRLQPGAAASYRRYG